MKLFSNVVFMIVGFHGGMCWFHRSFFNFPRLDSVTGLPSHYCNRNYNRYNLVYNKILLLSSKENSDQWNNTNSPSRRSITPSRFDKCHILFSAIVGVDPKESYLSNGHYVINFPVALIGHFEAINPAEIYKPTETTWLQCEVWDEVAKKNYLKIKKGNRINGIATLLENKWTDKQTGEEKKKIKIRILNIIDKFELDEIIEPINKIQSINRSFNKYDENTDSNFSVDHPKDEDQIEPFINIKSKNRTFNNNDYNNSNSNNKDIENDDSNFSIDHPIIEDQTITWIL
eukprot:gene4502-6361_t